MKARTTADLPTGLEILVGLFKGHDSDTLAELLPLAAKELPGLIDSGFNETDIAQAAKRIGAKRDPHAAEAIRLVQALQNTSMDVSGLSVKTNDALEAVQWINADAGFALGLLAGLRLGGAR